MAIVIPPGRGGGGGVGFGGGGAGGGGGGGAVGFNPGSALQGGAVGFNPGSTLQGAGGAGYVQGGGGACCASPGGAACSAVGCEDVVACGTGSGPASLSFVGGGRGSYTTATEYKFVGAGAGEFEFVKPKPNYCICIVSSTALLLILGLLLWFLLKDTTNTTTRYTTCQGCLRICPAAANQGCLNGLSTGVMPSFGMCSMSALVQSCQMCSVLCPKPAPDPVPVPVPVPVPTPSPPATEVCTIWGDPHIVTFDKKRVDFYTPGEYWLVKSDTVWVQGRYKPTHATSGLSVMKEIAFGGPSLNNAKLIITSTSASYNGKSILTGFPSAFNMGGVDAHLDSQGATMQKGRQGLAMHVVHLSLPNGMSVQINRWTEAAEGNYINARIMMHRAPGQDGHCGNFNGKAEDDSRLEIRARVGKTGVADGPQFLFEGGKTEVNPGNRPDINDCPAGQLDDAHKTCKESEKKFIPSMACLIDVCFGGTGFAHQG